MDVGVEEGGEGNATPAAANIIREYIVPCNFSPHVHYASELLQSRAKICSISPGPLPKWSLSVLASLPCWLHGCFSKVDFEEKCRSRPYLPPKNEVKRLVSFNRNCLSCGRREPQRALVLGSQDAT